MRTVLAYLVVMGLCWGAFAFYHITTTGINGLGFLFMILMTVVLGMPIIEHVSNIDKK